MSRQSLAKIPGYETPEAPWLPASDSEKFNVVETTD